MRQTLARGRRITPAERGSQPFTAVTIVGHGHGPEQSVAVADPPVLRLAVRDMVFSGQIAARCF